MTLAQRYRLANLALRVFMALGPLIGLAALWHWAYRFGELAFLHAGLQGGPVSGGSVRAFGYLLSMGVMGAFFAAIQGERIAVRLVALASDGAGMPRTRAEYGEGAEPTSLPVTRTWKTDASPSVLDATLVVAPSGVALSQASDMYKADPFIFWLIVSIAFVVIIIGASVFVLSLARGGRRGQVEGLVVDERGIRRWTSRGDEVTLAWSDVRLLEVTRLNPNQRDTRTNVAVIGGAAVFALAGALMAWARRQARAAAAEPVPSGL